MNVQIRIATDADRNEIFRVEAEAFGYEKEAKLVESLLDDPTAGPRVSLLAMDGDKPIGHILFTAGRIEGTDLKVSLLAPLAVVPEAQSKGIGGLLIKAGIERLKEMGFDLVCVLGHPTYYPRSGFTPSKPYGIEAPYPIPEEFSDAWMVQILNDAVPETINGKFACAEALDRPEHWRE